MLWVGQSKTDEIPRQLMIQVSPIGLKPKTLVVTSMDTTMRISLKGSEEKLNKVRKNLEAYVDLARADVGTNRYSVLLPEDIVGLTDGRPIFAKVTLERYVERTVPVDIEGIGTLKDKTQSLGGTLEADPNMVAVAGAQSQVEQVAKGVARLNLGELDTKESKPIPLQVFLVDRDDNRVMPRGDETLVVRPPLVYVVPRFVSAPSLRTLVVVPKFTGSPKAGYLPNGYTIDPAQVEVRGKSLDVARITVIDTEPIDVSGIEASKEFVVKLRVPPGLQLQRKTLTVKVRYDIRADVNTPPVNKS